MELDDIKKEMLLYRDLYGGDLLLCQDVESAKTKKELHDIIENHRQHIESMLSDAMSHLDRFKKRIGLDNFEWC